MVIPSDHSADNYYSNTEATQNSGEERVKTKPKSTTQLIIDTIYAHGCIKREDLIKEIMTVLQEDPEKLEARVAKSLARLVKKGVIRRVAFAIYCKP
jgi:6-phosphogluconate dehydrogenase